MAADAWVEFDGFKEYLGDGTIDMDADVFKTALFTSTSTNANDVTVDAFATLNNEVTGNGYAQHSHAATSTWVRSGSTVTFDADDAVYTASGGSIVARWAVMYDDTVATPVVDANVCYSLLDNTPGDVTVTDTNTLTIQMNASGILTLS